MHPRTYAGVLSKGKGVSDDAIKAHVRARLAGYKAPRHVMIVDSVDRAATGKADYNAVRERVTAWLATKGTAPR